MFILVTSFIAEQYLIVSELHHEHSSFQILSFRNKAARNIEQPHACLCIQMWTLWAHVLFLLCKYLGKYGVAG